MTAPTRLTAEQAAAALADAGVGAVDQSVPAPPLAELVESYLAALNTGEQALDSTFPRMFLVDPRSYRANARFLRVLEVPADNPDRSGSVHAFIDTTDGSLHKPAGLKGPAKSRTGQLQPRYQLANETERTRLLAALVTGRHQHGGYLYAGAHI